MNIKAKKCFNDNNSTKFWYLYTIIKQILYFHVLCFARFKSFIIFVLYLAVLKHMTLIHKKKIAILLCKMVFPWVGLR